MRFFTAALAASALTLSTTLVAPSYADPSPTLPDQAAEQAVEALASAQEALEGKGDVDPTIALAELQQVVGELPRQDRREAKKLFARPDQDPNSADMSTGAAWDPVQAEEEARTNCRANVCVHYLPSGNHKATDDWANITAHILQTVWNREVGSLNYRAPLPDGQQGGGPKLDVYLSNVGEYGLYGYAVPEQNTRRSYGYLVLDNDFSSDEFGVSPFISLKATAAHEFFHAVQFAYDSFEHRWLMETTATWMEEQVFDDVNDNRFYLRTSSLRSPGVPLSAHGPYLYGNWGFFQLMSERFGRALVLNLWTRAGWDNWDSYRALRGALATKRTNLAKFFGTFSAANNIPGHSYSEGRYFPRAEVARQWTLSLGSRGTGTQSPRLKRLTSRNFTFGPARNLTGRWRLRVAVNGPSGDSSAYAVVHYRGGTIKRFPIVLNRYGNATRLVPFSRASVWKVTVNIGNASPRVDGRLFRWSARAVR